MAVGVSLKPIGYVLEDDRGLPNELQTIFWIRPKRGHEANESTQRYLKTLIEKDNGVRIFDPKAGDAADVEEFCSIVEKVENFAFPEEYYESFPKMKDKAVERTLPDGETAYFIKEIVDRAQIADVARWLSNDHLREIIRVSSEYSKLKEGEKKF